MADNLICYPKVRRAMKKEMSSFDVRSMALEMAALEGGHMDKVFQWDSGTVLFRVNISGEGKKDLLFKDGRWQIGRAHVELQSLY